MAKETRFNPKGIYHEYEGHIWDCARSLKEDGREIVTASQIMEKRLELENSNDEDLRENWYETSFMAKEGIVHLPNNEIMIVGDIIPYIGQAKRFVEGALFLGDLDLSILEGTLIKKGEYKDFIGPISEKNSAIQVNNPLMQTLSGRDPHLVQQYTDLIKRNQSPLYKGQTNTFYLSDSPIHPTLRPLVIGDVKSGSQFHGNLNLNIFESSLVGKLR